MIRYLLTSLLLTLTLSHSFILQAQEPPQPLVSILEKDGVSMITPGPKPKYIQELGELGLMVDLSAGTTHQTLTWEQLKNYPVLVMTSFTDIHGRSGYDPEFLGDLLDRYLAEGGSILYIGNRRMASVNEHDQMNDWLAQYGAAFRWATVLDSEHSYDNPPPLPYQRPGIIWTTNLVEHPVTKGVNTLFVRNSCFYTPYLRPLTVSDDWTVLVRAMPSASVVACERPLGAGIARQQPETAEQEAAPLIAVRQVGKGRIALFGHDAGPFWFDIGKPAIGAICSKNGDGERKSDWFPLLRNLCVWLSEPARESGFPGGTMSQSDFTFRPDYGSRNPIDWQKPDISWSDKDLMDSFAIHSPIWSTDDWREMANGEFQALPILVGARTQLSGGKGSVEDWKKAALAAGYAGVAFREDLLNLTREQWEAFEAECLAATDDSFVALPGQQFTEWEGNRFLRFNWDIPWHNQQRLTDDGTAVREQLHFFFDAGHPLPANFPLTVQGNPAPWWSYRVYDALPVAVYQGGKRIEDNTDAWRQLVERIEFTSPIAVHLLDDPAQVSATRDDFRLYLLARSIHDLRTNPMWRKRAVGLGTPNNAATFVSNGPIIDAFLPLAMNRTTLGARGIMGSYQHRLIVRAHAESPIAMVEVWAGGDCIRRYRPNSTNFYHVVDDLHDRQRGVWLRVVDSEGREAMTTSVNTHDKMLYLQWCGDHCNQLGGGMGVDANGDPAAFGVATHVKLKLDTGIGPGANAGAADNYIPWGTDTGSPTLGLIGQFQFTTIDGVLPPSYVNLTPDLKQWYNNRNVWITRLHTTSYADRRIYLDKDAPKKYDSGYISSWGAYVKQQPLESLEMVHDDIDFHRNAGEPAFQWVRGTVTFKQDVTLSDKGLYNLAIGRSNWFKDNAYWVLNGRRINPDDSVGEVLGVGGYFSFPNVIGNGTIFALDDTFAIRGKLEEGRSSAFFYGFQLGERTFKLGDTLDYSYLIMRWPVGMPLDAGLDARITKLLLGPDRLQLTATRGKLLNVDFGFRVAAKDWAFQGVLPGADLSVGIPLQVEGLNPNWAAGLWWEGKGFFEPLAPDPETVLWAQLNPTRHSGAFFAGNVLNCDNPDIILRLFQKPDGWTILAHNPTDQSSVITIQGTSGGPVSGFSKSLTLAPGQEVRLSR